MTGIIAAVGISLLVSFAILPPLIKILYRFKFGQEIRDDGPQGHKTKQGTPTMGGIAIIFGTVVGYFGAHAVTMTPPTVSGVLVILLFVGLGCVGFLDDFIKIYKRRSLGLAQWCEDARPDHRGCGVRYWRHHVPQLLHLHAGLHPPVPATRLRSPHGRVAVRDLGAAADRGHL